MHKKFGYRGYIGSRPLRDTSFPHRVQNLVIRDYAVRHGLAYKLSATEYAMPGCYMMLTGVMEELPLLEGVILFSLFMLPQRQPRRLEIYQQILSQGGELHAALEEMVLQDERDIDNFEEMIEVVATLPHIPLGGYYQKVGKSSEQDSFWQALASCS
jgi:sporadic carbohydrate cluster protein (TIGR04323 family)